LSPEVHSEFWSLAHQMGTPEEIDELVQTLKINLLNAQEYQKELWESAYLSYKERKTVKTQRLIELEHLVTDEFVRSIPYPKGSKNYQDIIDAYGKRKKIADENARRLLKAAAEHRPLNSVQGQIIELDKKQIESVLSNLSNSFMNLNNLLDENWNP